MLLGARVELAKYNIRVNAIAPGGVKTKLNEALRSDPEAFKQVEAEIPLGRCAELSEIAGAALFLASDASSYITGHTIIAMMLAYWLSPCPMP